MNYLYGNNMNENDIEKLKEIFNIFSSASGIEAHYDFIIQENSLVIFSDKKVIPAQLIFLISEIFIFEGISISDNVPLAVYSFK